jgi:GT2 family glycosyltransferase
VERVFIGIPIVNRVDLMARCLRAIDVAAEILIVDNSCCSQFKESLTALAEPFGAEIAHQAGNIGVAASWNSIIRTGFERGYDRVFIGSNDTFLHAGALATAIDTTKESSTRLWHLHAWNFFLLHRSAVADVGWFDENFYPAYMEDSDYAYRCRLAGVGRAEVDAPAADHAGSATIRSDPKYALRCRYTHWWWNATYYRLKWGGPQGYEKFHSPFRLEDKDHRWWPDPSESVRLRDWNRDELWPLNRPGLDRRLLSLGQSPLIRSNT